MVVTNLLGLNAVIRREGFLNPLELSEAEKFWGVSPGTVVAVFEDSSQYGTSLKLVVRNGHGELKALYPSQVKVR